MNFKLDNFTFLTTVKFSALLTVFSRDLFSNFVLHRGQEK